MAAPAESLLHHLHGLLHRANSEPDDDATLLQRFAARREEAPFAVLLARHGPMVLSVCRRILGDDHEAEDVFQATFLLLARKAGSLGRPETVSAWLYGVARRLALMARRSNVRRLQRERDSAAVPASSAANPLDELSARELLLILDEELARLPERYRLPLILCGLEGRSQAEAAQLLGWTAGSLKNRLERGRARLRVRLTRRGLTLSASLLLLDSMANSPVSAALRQATVQKALVFTAGSAEGIAAKVLSLAEAETARITMTKAKAGLVLLMMVGLAAGTSMLIYPVQTEKPTVAKKEDKTLSLKSEATKQARTDRYGDPLPPGALMRLGTLRFRVPTWMSGGYQDLPDQRTKLVHTKSALLWLDAETWKEIDRWVMPRGVKVNNVSPDGKRALLSDSNSLQLWDTATRQRIQTFDHKNEYEQIYAYFPPDGKTLVTHHGVNYNPGLVRVWDVAMRKELWHEGVMGFWNNGICPLGFRDDGRTLIVQNNKDNTISLRDLRTGKAQRSFATMPKNDSRSIRLSPDGRTIMIGTAGPTVRSWDILSGKENPPLGGHKGQAHTFAFSTDSKSVVTGGEDSFVQVWDWPSGRLRRRIDFGSGSLGSIAFTPDGQRLEVVIWGEHALRYWDVKNGRELPPRADGHRGSVNGLAFLPRGEIVTTAMDNTIRVWDPASGRTLRQFPTQLAFGATKFSLSADGKTVAVADMNRPDIQLLDAATGRNLRTIKTAYKSCICIAFSPAGKLLASTSHSSQPDDHRCTVQLWDVATGQEVRRIDDKFCGWLTFSPDGQLLAIKHKDAVGIWRVATGERQRSINFKDPRGMCFSPDGRMLTIGSPENGISIRETASTKERLHLKPADKDCWSNELCFSPDGCYLASAGGVAKAVDLWDARTGELIHRFTGHESGPQALAFSADGRILASSSFDTTVLLWDMSAATAKRRTLPAELSVKQIEACWDTLAGEDAAAAYRAIWTLTASPRATVAFLREHPRRVEPVAEKRIDTLVRELDSPDFATRDRAAEELAMLDRAAEPALRMALAGQPSLEMRRRIQQLLERLAAVPSSAQLRLLRAIETLEHIGTPEARQVLEELAGGAAEARLTQETRASLRRCALK